MPPETAGGLLAEGRRRLAASGVAAPALDARLLLQHAAGLSHEDIVAEPRRETAAGDEFRTLIARRQAHEPVSRILGEREFHGRLFHVTPAVLDPRPDTETLVEAVVARMGAGARVLDLGTGSGAIIVTILAERTDATGVATDLSAAALQVANANALRHGAGQRLRLVHCSWFEGVEGLFDVIVSNPPYIPLGDIAGLTPDVRDFDPWMALDGGPDGLMAYRRIAAGARPHLAEGGSVMVEIGAGQQRDVEAIFQAAGFALTAEAKDLAGHVRCLAFR